MKDGDAKGGFFPMDDLGYIINPTNLVFIPTHWQPLLDALKDQEMPASDWLFYNK